MRDAELRELENLGRAGDADAGARWLLARLRLGTITPERIEAAAHVGDEGARKAVLAWRPICQCRKRAGTHGRDCVLAGEKTAATRTALRIPPAFELWLRELPEDRDVLARATLAILGFQPEPTEQPESERAELDRLEHAIRKWIACPCARHAKTVADRTFTDAELRDLEVATRARPAPAGHCSVLEGAQRWNLAAHAIAGSDPFGVRAGLALVAAGLVRDGRAGEGALREAIRDAVSRWALAEPRKRAGVPKQLVQRGSEIALLRNEVLLLQTHIARALAIQPRRLAELERKDELLPADLAERFEAYLRESGKLAEARRVMAKRR